MLEVVIVGAQHLSEEGRGPQPWQQIAEHQACAQKTDNSTEKQVVYQSFFGRRDPVPRYGDLAVEARDC